MPNMKDGFKALITIQGISGQFEEVELTPPGMNSGGVIDQTTMRNSRYRTALGKALITLEPVSIKVAYDPRIIAQMHQYLGTNRHITVTFPDGSTLVFYAIIDSWNPDPYKEGERPEGTLQLTPSNLSTATTPVETAPVFATGTTATTTTTAGP